VIQVDRHVGDRKAGIFEEARGTHQPRHGEIPLGRWKARAEKATDQRARSDSELTRQFAHRV
jgi:hypothetical protein